MRLRETPETDAHSPKCYSITTPGGTTTRYVPADFASKLERERDDAREQLRLANIDCFAALTELDAAREKIAELLGKDAAK